MSKYRVCDDIPRHCKTFNTLKDLVEWAQEEINKEIKVGDEVRIIDTKYRLTDLKSKYFTDIYYEIADVETPLLFDIVRYFNDNSGEDVTYYKGEVVLKCNDVYFIKCYFLSGYEYIVMRKEGIEKC